nr:hypothetical protein [Tanacetum cinerariifolium]
VDVVDKKDSDFDEILDDLFSIGAENLRRMGKEKIQHWCNVNTSRDTKHESGNLLNFFIFPATNEFYSNYEQDVDLEKEEAEVEDDDDGDTYDIWDITVKDIERIRQFLMPNVPDEMNEVIQHLIPQHIHTTPPNDDYVAPATKSILDELLEEFRDLIMNVTTVDEEAAKDPQSYFMEIQVHSVIIKPKPFIHTQPMSPLYGIFESCKSSIKSYKVDREMKSPFSILASYQQKAEINETTDVYKEGHEMEDDMVKTNLHEIRFHDVLFDFASCFDIVHSISDIRFLLI